MKKRHNGLLVMLLRIIQKLDCMKRIQKVGWALK